MTIKEKLDLLKEIKRTNDRRWADHAENKRDGFTIGCK